MCYEKSSVSRSSLLPLSSAQRGLWFSQQLDSDADPDVYKISEYLELLGFIDQKNFEIALQKVLTESDAYRSVFFDTPEGPRQCSGLLSDWELPVLDFRHETSPEAAAKQWMQNDFNAAYNLNNELLFSFALLRVGAERFYFYSACNHLISDGYGAYLFIQRLADVYSSLMAGEIPTASPFGQLSDLLDVESQYQASKRFENDRKYWHDSLENRPEPVSLARRAAPCLRIIRQQINLSAQTTKLLRKLLSQYPAYTFPQLLFSLVTIYLQKMTGKEDLLVGATFTGRVGKAQKTTPSMSANLLPLNLKIFSDLTLKDCLEQLASKMRGAMKHQQYRSEMLKNDLKLISNNSALFATSININPFQYDMTFSGKSVQPHKLSMGPVTDLTITVCNLHCDCLELCIDANAALYSDADVEAHLERLSRFFESVYQYRNATIRCYPLLLSGEENKLLTQLNDTYFNVPQDTCIHQVFEQQAVNQPDAVAVVSGGHSLTYGELNAQANQLAHYLRAQGVAPDSLVALCLDRGVALIVAMLAVLKAGGAYIPMDPAYPSERLQYIVQDSEPKVLIKDNSVALETFGEVIGNLTVIDSQHDGAHWSSLSTDNPQQRALTSQHLAYVVYTSGSTGKPKGVMVEHRNLMNLVHWHNRTFDVTTGTCSSAVAGLGFDASVWEIWPPLCAGAYLTLPSLAISKDPEALLAWWVAQPIEVGFLSTPLAELAFAKALNHPTLRTLLVGGDRLHRRPPKNATYQLINNYGPTETTVVATSGEISADSEVLHIGGPIDNTQIYILGEDQTLLPEGVKGEVYIGGLGVARGYLNRPELNESSFILDPFSSQPTARLYRTGDLARWGADGRLEYLGRNDDQVKIRGFRIELGEIEAALQASEWVEEAIVLALNTSAEHEDKRLVAYYTAKADEHVSIEDIRSHLAAHLPSYMVPAAYVQLDKLPLTANGKVDRKALPEPDESAFSRREYQAPEGELEQVLANIWQDLLKVEKVGRHDNFFELGGHSLKAVQLIEQLRQQSYHLSIKHLFNQPTLAALASSMGAAEEALESFDVPPNLIPQGCERITPEMLPLVSLEQEQIDRIVLNVVGGGQNVQDIYPLVPLQEGILFHHLLETDKDPYINRVMIAFDTQAQLHAFIDAMQYVIGRHDILRTAIVWEGLDAPVQVVYRDAQLVLETLDITADDVADELQQRFDSAHSRLTVSKAPMMAAYQAADSANNRYLLCLLVHHLNSDHTTLELMMEEVQAYLKGQADLLAAPLPFRNFVARVCLSSDPEAEKAYFTERLGDIDTPTAPFDLQDVQGEGLSVQDGHITLEDEVSQQLRLQAQRLGLSTASLFHLAWGLVLRATTGRDDVVFGTVLFGRMDAGDGADRVLGMFLNTLPLRLSLANQTVVEALQQTHGRLAELLDYEHASLVMAQQCSGVPSQMPLFSSLLNYRYDGGSAQLAGRPRHELSANLDIIFSQERTNYPLSMSVNNHVGGGFSLDAQVDGRIDCERIMALMVTALSSLVSALQSHLKVDVCQLNALPAAERQRVLVAFNQTHVDFPSNQYVHQLFEQQVVQQPDRVAVQCAEECLTYSELNARANPLAHWLVEQGVRPDSRVAVCLERSCDLVVSLLAVLKAGGAYVPLDPSYPKDRLEYMLNDSQPVVLITTSELLGQFGQRPAACRVADIGTERPWLSYPKENPDPRALGLTHRHLAYVIYTSGSTGRPKGVMNEHSGVVNRLQWMKEDYRFTPDDVILQKTPFSFDVSVWEFFGSLYAGARLVMAAPEGHKDPVYLRDLIEQQQITILHFVPPMLEAFLEILPSERCSSLRLIFCSGEALLAATIRKAYRRLPHITLHNLYGPTEAAVDVSAWACPRDLAGDKVLIGAPVANTQMYVLDSQAQPVPEGVSGELYIGGIQVARGYLNQPELSAERFLVDPFRTDPEARLYRTGDLGRWRADGTLEYLGRNDDQVKIRGFRIELGEISSVLQDCLGIQEAVVVAHGVDDKRLVAYYTQDDAAVFSLEELKATLAERLPEHMVPAVYIRLAALPLTANGKLDRSSLPEPDDSALVRRQYEAPQGELEQSLADIWQVLLKIDKVGRHDNFFELGGHSLMAVQLIEKLRQKGHHLAVKSLFTQPTLETLAATIIHDANEPSKVIEVPANLIPAGCEHITPNMLPLVSLNQMQIDSLVANVAGGARNVQDIYPLVPLQEGILFHHMLETDSDPYLNRMIVAFDTQAQLLAFIDAVRYVIGRHDILRTSVVWERLDTPVQVVHREVSLLLETLHIAEEDVVAELQRRFDPKHTRLDLTQAPMMAAYQVQDANNQRWLLCLLNHHLNSDHTTIELMLEEVQTYLSGQPERLPVPVPFRDFVARVHLNANPEAEKAYFSKRLGDIDTPTAPFDLLDVHGDGVQVQENRVVLEDGVAQSLRQQAQRLGVSTASLFHLAWGMVLRATTGRDDVVFGTVLFGRMDAGDSADRAFGMFLNSLPLRLTLGKQSVEEALQQTHSELAELLSYEHASLVSVQKCSGVPAQTPLFSSILNYRYDGGSEQLDKSLQASWLELDVIFGREQTNYPISVSVNDHSGIGFSLDVQVDSRIGCERISEMMVTSLSSLVVALSTQSTGAVGDLNVLSEQKRHRLVSEFNQTNRWVDQAACVHSLIEQQAVNQPDAVAVVSGGHSLTYGELNAQANQLAHYLRAQGVAPDSLVALCLDRGVALIVAMLAVLKAGGAYIPMDPAYPSERLQYIVQDSEPKVLIKDNSVALETFGEVIGNLTVIDSQHDGAHWSSLSTDNPQQRALTSQHLAYVVYTSGSTGKPKGVMVEHRNLMNLVHWHNRTFDVTTGTCSSAVAGLGFDASVWEIWPPLCAGAYLTLPSLAISKDPEALLAWWVAQPIEVGFLSTPLAELAFAKALNHPTLRTLLVGGDRLHRRPPKNATYQLINNYGPTETTVVATSGEISADSEVLHIGGPIDNTQIYILGEDQTLLPEGVKGEVYIGGLGVARGYLNRPELNESSFILDPFSSQPTARLYRTGDLARWGADGRLEYLGRNDDQVKIRGFRIELGEIEAALQASEWVEEAIVLALNTSAEHEDKRLVAYYTAKADEHVSIEDIRSHLAAHLPSYMVPAAYVQLDKLPLTANGKVDRKALPEPDESAFSRREYQAPEGELEQVLANIWQDLLKVEKVGRHDNFFELGGHSLKAVQLIEQLRQQSYHLSIKHLFNQPTLAALASSMGAAEEALESFDVPPNLIPQGCERITPEMLPLVSLEQEQIDRIVLNVVGGGQNVQDIYPLVPLQEGILFHHLLETDKDPYINRVMIAFDTQAQLHAFIDAMQYVIGRHDILRTAIVWEGLDAPVQVVYRDAQLVLETLDITADDVADELQQRFDSAHSRLTVSKAPMMAAYQAADSANNRYLLCLLVHHLNSDHTTLELMMEEVQAYLKGQADLLAAPLPFRNFVARVCLSSDPEAEKAYFTERLGDIDTPTAPFDLQDVQGEGLSVQDGHITLEDEVSQQLRLQAQRLGLSTASLFHLAWGLVLRATTGRDDVVFGTVLFGRMDAGDGADRVLGMFLNTLPLRLSLANQTVVEALQQTHGRLAELLDYEHASLVMAQQCSGVPSQMPLFSSLLNYRYDGGSAQLAGRPRHELSANLDIIFSQERTNYPLSMSVNDHVGGGFSLDAQVDGRIDCERIMALMVTALSSLVSALQSHLKVDVCQLNALPAAERQRVLVAFNQTHVDFPSNQYVHQLFEQQVVQQPDRVAVQCAEECLTYSELNARANPLAHWLVEQGVRPDSRVAVCLERSCDLVVSLLAVLKAGGAYVPLDPSYPKDRLEYMLNDSQPVVLITTSELLGQFGQRPAACRVADIGTERPWLSYPKENPDPRALGLTHRHLAYVIYTSGSTGRPKGVMNEHSGVVNRLQWMKEDYRFTPDDVILQKTPFSFDVSVWEFFGSLYAGARLVMAAPEGHKDPVYLRDLIEQQQITILHFVPPMLEAFLEILPSERCSSLRLIFCSGEALLAATIRKAYRRLPHITLHNLYGPTEAAVDVSAWACPRDLAGDKVLIGAPVANTQMYVLDSQAQPVPEGVSGELYIGGIQVARGYLNQPELSAERFLVDPFRTDPEARLYRTGDLGRWRADGTLEYLGRNDDQVKIRGFRIELGEISSVLQDCLGIQEAVVVAHGVDDKRLVAYYTQDDAAVFSLEELKATLAERLPEHMVPAVYIRLAALPLTANGKLDRSSLPEPDDSALVRRQYEAPQGELEQSLADIWQVLLKIDKVGRHDNFFELGGHSLMAVQLIEKLRQKGHHLAVKSLFTQPTLETLAATIIHDANEPSKVIEVPANLIPAGCEHITPNMLPLVSLNQMQIDSLVANVAGGARNVQDIYPLVPLQEGILFHHMLETDSDPYLNRMIVAFDTQAQLLAFIDAVRYVIGRHDILRTSVVWERLDTPVQVVHREVSLLLETLHIAEEDVVAELQRRFDPKHTRLDLTQAPMMAAYQVQDANNQRWLLCLLNHHLNSDHTTIELMLEEVQTYLSGQPERLPVPVPFRDFVARVHLNANPEAEKAYFSKRLGDIDTPTAPFDLLDVHGDGVQVQENRVVLEDGVAQSLRQQAQRLGVSTASLFHLAWGMVLRATTGRDDVVFGTVLFGRMDAGDSADRAFGMFLNSLPLRLTLGKQSVEEALQQTHSELAELLSYEHASLVSVQKCSGVPAQTPLFSSILNYRYDGGSEQLDKSLQASWLELDVIFGREQTNYPISVSVNDHSGIGFSLDVQVDSRIGCERISEMMVTSLSSLVVALSTQSTGAVGDLNVLSEQERHRVLYEVNATQTNYPDDVGIHRLFSQQVNLFPDAVAITSGECDLSYAGLEARANRVALKLQSFGVLQGHSVVVQLPRSVEYIVAVLAILKCGAVYVPLDPKFPEHRLNFVLEDCHASVLIAEQESACECKLLRTLVLTDAVMNEGECSFVDVSVYGDSPAYIMYTSGSTGQPKGVVIPHRGIARLVINNGYMQVQPTDKVGFAANPAFDATTLEIWAPLLHGASVVVISADTLLNVRAFAEALTHKQVSILWLTVGLFNQYADDLGQALCGLRYLLVGGDVLQPAIIRRVLATNPPMKLLNGYGPTETTTFALTHEIQKVDDDASSIPLGRPIGNTQVYILNDRQQPLPQGVVGEMYIGGDGVALEYLSQPALTQAHFLPDPFSTRPNARLYRTGDLAYWREDGVIEFAGRNDFQVKIRGYRIELGEIEMALLACSGVEDALVVARGDKEKRLVAYYTEGDEPLNIAQLKAELRDRLPDYMIPVVYMRLEELPLTDNGKVNRKALPEPDESAFSRREYEVPEGELEQVLANIWQDLLKVEKVGRHDNFFELGGHSLLAVKLLTRLRDTFNVDISLADLFAYPELNTLAQFVMKQKMSKMDEDALIALALEAGYDESEVAMILAEMSKEVS